MGEYEHEPDPRLLRCPFCGSTTATRVTKWFNVETHEYEDQWQVMCGFNDGGCGAAGGIRQTEGDAINTWNRRAIG